MVSQKMVVSYKRGFLRQVSLYNETYLLAGEVTYLTIYPFLPLPTGWGSNISHHIPIPAITYWLVK
jgi:hypothetical protein